MFEEEKRNPGELEDKLLARRLREADGISVKSDFLKQVGPVFLLSNS